MKITELVKLYCPYCKAKYTKNAVDGVLGEYGCDTGCEYVRYSLICPKCHREVEIGGEFEWEVTPEKIRAYIADYDQAALQNLLG